MISTFFYFSFALSYYTSKEDFQGGLVAVNMEGELYDESESSQEIREYRYSGPTVDNYVTFNDELWRIIGIFKDEKGAEHLKIVKEERLYYNGASNYTINNIEYAIKKEASNYKYYWNNVIVNEDKYNDWSTSGLMYWLNTEEDETKGETNKGYLSLLTNDASKMIEETEYYLGSVTGETVVVDGESNVYITDTPMEAYKNERMVTCEGGTGPTTNDNAESIEANTTCRVWADNAATWTGKVALMYPSDYGFSFSNKYWIKKLNEYNTIMDQSWMNSMDGKSGWLFSPTTNGNRYVAYWASQDILDARKVNNYSKIIPTLYLKSNVKISSGDGTEKTPYTLSMN